MNAIVYMGKVGDTLNIFRVVLQTLVLKCVFVPHTESQMQWIQIPWEKC